MRLQWLSSIEKGELERERRTPKGSSSLSSPHPTRYLSLLLPYLCASLSCVLAVLSKLVGRVVPGSGRLLRIPVSALVYTVFATIVVGVGQSVVSLESLFPIPFPQTTTPSDVSREESISPPRPPNAFMVFRSVCWAVLKHSDFPERHHANFSVIIGRRWHMLTPAQQAVFGLIANEEKEIHAERYPGYKYRPAKKAKKGQPVKEGKEKKRAGSGKAVGKRSQKREDDADFDEDDGDYQASSPRYVSAYRTMQLRTRKQRVRVSYDEDEEDEGDDEPSSLPVKSEPSSSPSLPPTPLSLASPLCSPNRLPSPSSQSYSPCPSLIESDELSEDSAQSEDSPLLDPAAERKENQDQDDDVHMLATDHAEMSLWSSGSPRLFPIEDDFMLGLTDGCLEDSLTPSLSAFNFDICPDVCASADLAFGAYPAEDQSSGPTDAEIKALAAQWLTFSM
ncbi:putative transcription factor SOX-14 [Grifola frondosa]|uniref:Putative transcription factor SOX-14 n=1 Tax=Grifola frondosa TaxID=5627 RepID=A0A1C7MSG7_GRIFR|nr:putative transcription factor SOX-14 [Grifola frondosa]